MVELYSRRAPNISTHSPVAKNVSNDLSKILGEKAVETAKIAGENFVLGQKQVLAGILDYGYSNASNNPQQFIEMTNEAFNKQAEGLPEIMREKMTENFLISQKNYLLKVEDNLIKEHDKQLVENSQAIIDNTTNQIQMASQNLYSSLVNGREEDALIARQNIEALKRQASSHSGLKKSNGDYIYGKDNREKLKNGEIYDAQYEFEEAVDSMSLDKLKEWDSEVFQNSLKWQKQTGIDKKTYNDQSKYIKNRLKELGDKDKREIKSDVDFQTANLIPNYNSDTIKRLRKTGIANDELLDAIENSLDKPKTVSEVQNTFSFAQTLRELSPLITNTEDSEAGNTLRFKAATELIKRYTKFAEEQGLSIEDQDDYLSMISKGLVDRQFSEALQPIYADNAINEIVTKYNGETRLAKALEIKEVKNKDEIASDTAYKEAEKIIKTAILLAGQGEYEQAKNTLMDGNKEIIRLRAAPYMSRWDIAQLEEKLYRKEKALFTTKSGTNYEFLGYSNKNAIFRTVK